MMALKRSTQESRDEPTARSAERDLAGLLAQLHHADPVARRWAARDLREHASASQALADALLREMDASVRQIMLTSLASLGDETAVTALARCLRSEDVALRNGAIEALKQLPDAVATMMEGLLRDADPDVRIFAVNILESLRHADVESWLIAVITKDTHLNVCATAVDLLGEVGTTASIAPLHQLKARFPSEPYIQFASDLALQRISLGQ